MDYNEITASIRAMIRSESAMTLFLLAELLAITNRYGSGSAATRRSRVTRGSGTSISSVSGMGSPRVEASAARAGLLDADHALRPGLVTPSQYARTAATLADAKKAGAVFAYGSFITVSVNFIILAFIIFMMVKQINRLKKEAPAAEPAPVVTPEDVLLLREIRDSLRSR